MPKSELMPAAVFEADARDVAARLLNCRLATDVDGHLVVLRITEVEAYLGVGQDPGSHAYRGQTPRNASMFLAGGHLYVYRSYGVHWCANIVVGHAGSAAAVLIRAGEIIEGADTARERRTATGTVRREIDLASGPGRTAAALGLTDSHDGVPITARGGVWIEGAASGDNHAGLVIGTSSRTGVSGAGSGLPFRYFIVGDPTVSPHRPGRLEKSAKLKPK